MFILLFTNIRLMRIVFAKTCSSYIKTTEASAPSSVAVFPLCGWRALRKHKLRLPCRRRLFMLVEIVQQFLNILFLRRNQLKLTDIAV